MVCGRMGGARGALVLELVEAFLEAVEDLLANFVCHSDIYLYMYVLIEKTKGLLCKIPENGGCNAFMVLRGDDDIMW